MNTHKLHLYLGSVLLLLSSCASLYVPNTVNSPLLTEKKETAINLSYGMNGFDLQGAYAMTNHIGLMVNTSASPLLNPNGKSFHGHLFAEAGLGCMFQFGESGVFDFYTGGGYGNIKSKSNVVLDGKSNIDEAEGNGYRYFIQPSIGFKKSNFQFAFSLRGVLLDLDNVWYQNSTQYTQEEGMFVEPTFNIRVGKKRVMFQSQIGLSMPIEPSATEIRYRPLMVSLGLCMRL